MLKTLTYCDICQVEITGSGPTAGHKLDIQKFHDKDVCDVDWNMNVKPLLQSIRTGSLQ